MSEATATLAAGDMDGPGNTPFWAKCAECHCWAAAYLPMAVRTLVKVTKNMRCPRCGHGKPVVAKQDNGFLKEPTS